MGHFLLICFFPQKKFGGFQPCSAYLRAGFGRLHLGALVVRVVPGDILRDSRPRHPLIVPTDKRNYVH